MSREFRYAGRFSESACWPKIPPPVRRRRLEFEPDYSKAHEADCAALRGKDCDCKPQNGKHDP